MFVEKIAVRIMKGKKKGCYIDVFQSTKITIKDTLFIFYVRFK